MPTATACCPAAAPWCSPTTTAPIARPDAGGCGRRGGRGRRSAAASDRLWPRALEQRGIPVLRNRAVGSALGGKRRGGRGPHSRCSGRAALGRAPPHRLRSPGDVRRLEPGRAPVQPVPGPPALRRGASRPSCRTSRFSIERSVGAANGSFALGAALAEGAAAGAARGRSRGFRRRASARAAGGRGRRGDRAAEPALARPAARAGAASASSISRTTSPPPTSRWRRARGSARSSTSSATRRLGMGTDQGKTVNVERAWRCCRARSAERSPRPARPPSARLTRRSPSARSPGRERGSLVDPVRVTPMHAWHVAAGAVFEDVGQWKRPRYYPRAGEDMERRCGASASRRATPSASLDASTLGKIEVRGPDAARVPRPHLHQPLQQSGGRPLPLRRDVPRRRHGVRRRRRRRASATISSS